MHPPGPPPLPFRQPPPLSVAAPGQPLSKAANIAIIAGLFVGLIALSAIWPKPPKPAPPTPEQRLAEARFQVRVATAHDVKAAILKRLNDPDSVRWDTELSDDEATVVCVTFGAKNAFGAMMRRHTVYRAGRLSDTAADWNARCANRRLNDLSAIW